MGILIAIPAGLLILGVVVLSKIPRWRRRRAFDRAGTPYCPHCLYDLTDVDEVRTEFCPGCGRRLPRFAVRKDVREAIN